MSMSQNFRELLSQATDQAERPRALADGHYIGTVGNHEFGLSRQKQTPYVRMFVTPEEACPDVEAEANKGLNIATYELRKDYFITPKAIYRLADALDAILGQETGRSYDERLPDTRDVRVMIDVGHRDSEDGKERFNEIRSIVRA